MCGGVGGSDDRERRIVRYCRGRKERRKKGERINQKREREKKKAYIYREKRFSFLFCLLFIHYINE